MGRPLVTVENPVPVIVTELTVTAAVPDAVTVSESAFDVPLVMLPKANVVALRDNCEVVDVPVPVSATIEVAPTLELLMTVNWPLTAPVVFGANVTGITSVWPGFSAFGRPVAAIVKPVPETARELTVTGTEPDEVNTRDNDLVVALVTLPKLKAVALSES